MAEQFSDITRKLAWDQNADPRELLDREWLVANGLGGYASASISAACTRKYHGLLIAALPVPYGRTVTLTNLFEELILPDGEAINLGAEERTEDVLILPALQLLREFRLEMGLPVWEFAIDGYVVEKRVFLVHQQNTVFISYRLLQGTGSLRLKLKPFVHFRSQNETSYIQEPYSFVCTGDRYEIIGYSNYPVLRLFLHSLNGVFVLGGGEFRNAFYRVEQKRCYDYTGNTWSPGWFSADLVQGHDTCMVASTEDWAVIRSLAPNDALELELRRRKRLLSITSPEIGMPPENELVLTADQFIIYPSTRTTDAARAHAEGAELRTIIAGYHWFTDWGRDTMISLEGLTLVTGRLSDAAYILRTFIHYVRKGLIPNMFPEGRSEGQYNTADATLWFFHAISRYLFYSGDRLLLSQILPELISIIDWHIRGTLFGIEMDPRDGLLKQGASGYQLTWMDAKLGEWVVTPRRGKAVEINALWYNALKLMEGWLRTEGLNKKAEEIGRVSDLTYESFNRRFWFVAGNHLYDVVDGETGNDPALRPNQLFAISLPNPVLDPNKWPAVVQAVKEKLLTPYGLRSLSPDNSDYKMKYQGDLCTRDAAYHQGTVWSWLIGPFIDAWTKVHPGEAAGARRFLDGLKSHLNEACIGSISEVFDAEFPFTPEGCISQAWSVAEFLRCWVKTAPDQKTEDLKLGS